MLFIIRKKPACGLESEAAMDSAVQETAYGMADLGTQTEKVSCTALKVSIQDRLQHDGSGKCGEQCGGQGRPKGRQQQWLRWR